MAYQTIDHQPLRRRTARSPLEITLLAGFLFCLVVGLIALAALLWLRSPEQVVDPRSMPAQAIYPERISAPLALMQLAGDAPDALARQAMFSGHLDTTFAIVAYTVEMPQATRQTILLQLASRFAENNRPAETAIAARAARSISLLEPELTPLDRHQALVQVASQFLHIDDTAAVEDTIEQALRTTTQTPNLLPAQRSQTFDALRPLAQQAGANLLAAQASEYARNPFLSPAGYLLVPRLAGMAATVAPEPAVVQATEARLLAARLLADRIQLTGGIDIEPEQQALAQALLNEDAARGDAYRTAINAGVSLAEQLALLLERRNWLALKARIGQGGFGITLVPEWETNAEFLLQDLSTVNNNINTVVGAMSNDIGDPVTQSFLRMEMLMELALQWEFGLHPLGMGTDLAERMRVVQEELTRLESPLALPIGFAGDAEPPGFRIQRQ